MSRMQKILAGVLSVVLLFFGWVMFRIGNKPADSVKLTPIAAADAYHTKFYEQAYPLQYNSYMKNQQELPAVNGYGGSIDYQHFDKQPENKTNFKGYGFSIDYTEDRGHTHALEEVDKTKRINDATKAACITCKTPYVEKLYNDMGWKYASLPFKEVRASIPDDGYISCANCHDPQTMKLRVINPAFKEALARQGKDIEKATPNEMRSYTCGQCHAEYYFAKDDNRVVFPWDKGMKPEEIYSYYEQKPGGFEADFVQPDSKVKVLKAQHPDFETWSMGIHADNGVTCVDCHMPYMRDNGQKYTSHWMTSPLRNPEDSCGKCHDDTDKLMVRVKKIQDQVFMAQRTAGQTVAKAHNAIAAAAASQGVDEAELANARELLRKAQWMWDFVAAENSMGFHNPDQALSTLSQSIDLAHQAIESATKASGAGNY